MVAHPVIPKINKTQKEPAANIFLNFIKRYDPVFSKDGCITTPFS
jgi:hypothetical protein